MEFIARIHYDANSRTALANLANRNLSSGKSLMHRIGCLLMGLAGIVAGVYFQRTAPDNSMISQLCLAYGTLFLGVVFFWRPVISRANFHMTPKRQGASEFFFDENGFSVTNMETYNSTQYPYSDLTKFSEVGNYFALFLGDKSAFLVDKNQFASGDVAEFPGFLQSQTGLLLEQ